MSELKQDICCRRKSWVQQLLFLHHLQHSVLWIKGRFYRLWCNPQTNHDKGGLDRSVLLASWVVLTQKNRSGHHQPCFWRTTCHLAFDSAAVSSSFSELRLWEVILPCECRDESTCKRSDISAVLSLVPASLQGFLHLVIVFISRSVTFRA